jgi:hypothetical protein
LRASAQDVPVSLPVFLGLEIEETLSR